MTTDATPAERAGDAETSTTFAWRVLWLLWAVRLFRPEWTLAYYVPALGFLRVLPTPLLAAVTCIWVASRRKRIGELKWIIAYGLFITLCAPFVENLGRTRVVVRFTFELFLLGAGTIAIADTPKRTRSILRLFMLQFAYLGVWGIVDGGRIPWDNVLNEEDSFGPLMCIGVAFCSQYMESARSKLEKVNALAAYGIAVVGVIASFARGSFMVLCAILVYRIAVSKRVIANAMFTAVAAIIVVVAASILFPGAPGESGSAFWKEMGTISEGTSAGTGEDRKILWGVAWEEFKAHPIMGVGAHNFGVAAPKFVGLIEDRGERYRDPMSIWGRSLHNGYFQVLSEGGLVGIFIYVAILIDFFWSNRKTRQRSAQLAPRFEGERFAALATGVKLGQIAFLLNLFFYDITYYDWFWNLLLLNALLTVRVREWSLLADDAGDRVAPRSDDVYWHPALGTRGRAAAIGESATVS